MRNGMPCVLPISSPDSAKLMSTVMPPSRSSHRPTSFSSVGRGGSARTGCTPAIPSSTTSNMSCAK